MSYKTESNKQPRQTNSLTQTSLVVNRGKEGEVNKDKGGQIYEDEKKFNFA